MAASLAMLLATGVRAAIVSSKYGDNLAGVRFTPPPPEALAARDAVRNDPQAATRRFKRRVGMIPAAG